MASTHTDLEMKHLNPVYTSHTKCTGKRVQLVVANRKGKLAINIDILMAPGGGGGCMQVILPSLLNCRYLIKSIGL